MHYLLTFLFLFILNSSILNLPEEPIYGHVEGTVTNIGERHKVFSGSGTNNIMGKVTVEVDYYITYETQYSGGCEGGSGVSRAANGDELYMKIESGSWYVNNMASTPEVIIEVNSVITGGTGKFKNATGTFSGTGRQIYLPGSPTSFDWSGKINY